MKSAIVLVLASLVLATSSAFADEAADLRAVMGIGAAASGVATSGGNVAVATGEGVVNNFNPTIRNYISCSGGKKTEAAEPKVVKEECHRRHYPATTPPAPTFKSAPATSDDDPPRRVRRYWCAVHTDIRLSGPEDRCPVCLESRRPPPRYQRPPPPLPMARCARHGVAPSDGWGGCVYCVQGAQAQYRTQGYYGSPGPQYGRRPSRRRPRRQGFNPQLIQMLQMQQMMQQRR